MENLNGFVEVPAGGFKSFRNVNNSSSSIKRTMPDKTETKYYTVEFSEDGLIKQLSTTEGKHLLDIKEYYGGEIRARMDGKWENNRNSKNRYHTGPIFDILERNSSLGEIPVNEKYYFFKNTPFIKVEIEFEFAGNEVGNMWIDESKINIYYPTKGSEIYYDIPFGYTEGKSNRPLFPVNWLYSNGLVYVNRGTIKHWAEDGLVGNVVAWGGNHFTNRRHWDWWISRPQYDIRLYNKQKIEYYLIPYNSFNAKNIIHDVDNIVAPNYLISGKGESSFYQTENKDIKISSVYSKEGEIWMRGYKIPSEDHSQFRDFEIFNLKLKDIK